MQCYEPFDPAAGDFPNQGNLIGWFDEQAVRLPDERRAGARLAVLGQGKAFDRWIVGQMLQDAQKGGLVCVDPLGKYASELVAALPRDQIRHIAWLDAACAERLCTLNLFDPFGQGDDGDIYEVRDLLFSLLAPLSETAQRCLEVALKAFQFSPFREMDRAFTLPALSLFLMDALYRRYILSAVPTWLCDRLPEPADFARTLDAIAPKLRPIVEDSAWLGRLGTQTSVAPEVFAGDKVLIVSGDLSAAPPIAVELWRFAFFQHLRKGLERARFEGFLPLYGFEPRAFDALAMERLIARERIRSIALTLTPEAYDAEAPDSCVTADDRIDFAPDLKDLLGKPHLEPTGADAFLFQHRHGRGEAFTARSPKVSTERTYRVTEVCRNYSRMKHHRKADFVQGAVDLLVRPDCGDRGDGFYAAFGVEAPSKPPKPKLERAAPIVSDNPFLNGYRPIKLENPFRKKRPSSKG